MEKVDHKPSREDRLKIAEELVKLSNQVLSTEARKHHIALKIGTGNYSNAVIVSDSGYVKFFIRSQDLRTRAAKEGFSPKPVKATGPWSGFGFRFWGLGLNDLQAHEGLFEALVQGSIKEIEYRKGQGKKR